MALQIAFVIFSLIALIGAFLVVTTRRLFHSALALVLSFVGVAGLYILLEAEFLAALQILIYVGAIAILIIFAVIVTRHLMDPKARAFNEQWWRAALVAAGLFLILVFTIAKVPWPVSEAPLPTNVIFSMGSSFVGTYLVPFEVISVLLMVALVGAIIIARER
ncbi:MAG: NADH-quinone oxidoreductase subunit J [Chloroflexi bacterium]|nr:MAG: NADH-quinone oxidoreductase subunit J [Chloroflexota bacterium]HDN79788.1 NADH-quinone oxidoreductase subunit J [Chloroflexota bacterium]